MQGPPGHHRRDAGPVGAAPAAAGAYMRPPVDSARPRQGLPPSLPRPAFSAPAFRGSGTPAHARPAAARAMAPPIVRPPAPPRPSLQPPAGEPGRSRAVARPIRVSQPRGSAHTRGPPPMLAPPTLPLPAFAPPPRPPAGIAGRPPAGAMTVDLSSGREVTTEVLAAARPRPYQTVPAGGGPPPHSSDGRHAPLVVQPPPPPPPPPSHMAGGGAGAPAMPTKELPSLPAAKQTNAASDRGTIAGTVAARHIRMARTVVFSKAREEEAFGMPLGVLIDPCPCADRRSQATGASDDDSADGADVSQADAVPLLLRTPTACSKCGGIINPFCSIGPSGNSWGCVFCGNDNAG